jgi:hypothetical protein
LIENKYVALCSPCVFPVTLCKELQSGNINRSFRIPMVFIFLGWGNEVVGACCVNCRPRFNIDAAEALKASVELHVGMTLRYLSAGGR